jgi:hypothetical protein
MCEQSRLIKVTIIGLTRGCKHAAVTNTAPSVKLAILVNDSGDVRLRSHVLDFLAFKAVDDCGSRNAELHKTDSKLSFDALTPGVQGVRLGIISCGLLLVN